MPQYSARIIIRKTLKFLWGHWIIKMTFHTLLLWCLFLSPWLKLLLKCLWCLASRILYRPKELTNQNNLSMFCNTFSKKWIFQCVFNNQLVIVNHDLSSYNIYHIIHLQPSKNFWPLLHRLHSWVVTKNMQTCVHFTFQSIHRIR